MKGTKRIKIWVYWNLERNKLIFKWKDQFFQGSIKAKFHHLLRFLRPELSGHKITIPLFCLVVFLAAGCAAGKKARIRAKKIDQVVGTARSYTGTPYKWGGTSRAGMDCSGLLLKSYTAIGMEIPRTSGDQSKYGKKVSFEELEKGDWVFFATGKKKRKITHVGLVTTIKGKESVWFIHSSSSLGVVEKNIYSDYYKDRFRKARRPF